jgi:integrase
MASIIRDPRRGTWLVQWFDGSMWVRTTVIRKRPGWKPGQPMPKKEPAEVTAALVQFEQRERLAKQQGRGYAAERTLEDFFAARIESAKLNQQPGTVVSLKLCADIFLGWCVKQKITRLADITTKVCIEWIEARAKDKAVRSKKPILYGNLKKERGMLAACWAAGLKRGIVVANPWIGVEVPGSPVKKKRGSWSPEEYARLIEASGPWLQDIILFGCHSGLRVEAIKGITWKDVHWNENPSKEGYGFLEVRPELDKTHRGYHVPIHPAVHDMLARKLTERLADVDTIFVGPKSGRAIKQSCVTAQAIISACKRAGLPRPDSPNHHMRRTFGRWAVLGHLTGKPVPLYVVSRWMGHASVAMTMQYLDMSHDDSTSWMLGDNQGDKMPGPQS